ncbi:MAG: SdrD B-like domain-containing protein [Thermodesulfovibrionales bacterium]
MHVNNLIKQVAKILVILLFVFSASYSYAAVPAGYSDYYIPGDEVSMWTIFNSLDAAATTTMHTVISVTAWSANTKVYYDHWESCKGIPVGSVGCTNGYNFDPDNPDATADEIVTLTNTGDQRVFESSNIPTNPRGTNTFYDGGDRIYVAGGAVTITRASWIESVGVGNQAAAWEIYPVKPQLTTYTVPFGENLGFTDFARVYVLIQATEDNTTFTVDLNGDGTPDMLNVNRNATKSLADGDTTTITLNKGQTFLLDRISACTTNPATCITNPGNLNSGTAIQGNKTLQVKFVAGNPNQNYRARGFSAFPRGFWTKDYYAPVDEPTGGTIHTDYYLHNPNAAAITISWSSVSTSGSFSIPAKSTVSFRTASGVSVPVNSGLYFRGSDVFWGVGVGDAGGNAYEWGYSLLPSTMLYNEHFLGWAPGSIPVDIAGNPGNQDNDGVFLIAAQDNTRVWVDFDGDGVADLIDANGDGTPESSYVTLNRLQTQFFYDPANAAGGGDLSKAHFWSTGSFMLAYGENADTATTSSPSLDLGYVGIPSTDFVSLVLTVDKSVSPQVVSTALGSQATFTIKVNSQKYTIDGVAVTDYLPASWQYVTDSAIITQPGLTQVNGSAANPTITGTGPYTLSWSSTQVGGNMLENQEITITFSAQTTAVLAAGTLSQNRIKAVGTRTFGNPIQTQTFTATDFVFVDSENSTGLTITKTSVADPLVPGQQFPYTVTLNNQSSTTLTGISIFDPLPAGVSYVAGSGSVTCELVPQNVRDEFASAAYNLNGPNNTATWAGNWTETDRYGNGATGATDGLVWVTGGALQFRYQASNVRDDFTTNVYTRNDGTNNWNGSWTETGDDNVANTGSITVDTGNNNRVNFGPGAAGRTITRTATVSGNSATISFTLSDQGIDNGEGIVAEYDLGLGAGFQTIQTITNNTLTGTNPLTLSTTGATSITLRFRSFGTYTVNDNAGVDAVNISFNNSVGTAIQRTANLTGASSALLNFSYAPAGLAAGDTLVVEASNSAAGPFTTLSTFTAGTPNVAPPYNLKPYISANTTIRYRITGGFNAAGKTFSVDNVDITYYVPSTFASKSPPDFLLRSTGCLISPGDSLTLTYNVTVDNPLATGIDQITNTAFINSNEIILPLSASVTNIVVNPSSQSASVGDKVWFDVNGNGVLDVGEPGLANVEVTLKDQYGTPLMTTMTDATGHYLFTGVQPGNGYYVEVTSSTLPSGLQQSAPSGHTDNRTNAFNLTNGQSYMDGDLGYKSAPGSAAVGNIVWSDANSNGTHNAGEAGLAGVIVQLCFDANGDGIWDTNEKTGSGCSTTTTAPDGSYLFTGVPASGTQDYFVYVDGAQTNLTGYTMTAPSTDPLYINNLSAGDVVQYANFGYHGTTYSITDRIWFDSDADGSLDVGEPGIDLVTVDLLDASLNAIATTTTDANGSFTFSGVKGGGADYTIRVTDTNSKLTDYFGTTASAITRSMQVPNLNGNIDNTATPHFGYGMRGGIGDTVFNDLNGNGTQDAGETGISGVIVKLYSDSGTLGRIDGSDAVVATLTTDADGRYLFSGRANGNYIVSIESPPGGYAYTGIGGNADSDPVTIGQQQAASIAGNGNVLNKDFAYQVPPASARSVSGMIWNDINNNGAIDSGETGIAGVTIDLLQGSNVIATTSTDSGGNYSFTGLPSNTYTVQITDNAGVLSGYVGTYEKTEGTTGPFNGQETVDLTSGNQTGVIFGYVSPVIPTLVVLSSFGASVTDGQVVIEWETATEKNTLGFYLLRLDAATGAYRSITEGLLPGLITDPRGGIYSLVDRGAFPGETYQYKLVEVERNGKQIVYGPFSVSVGTGNVAYSQSVRTNSVQASSTGSTSAVSGYSRRARQQSAVRESLIQTRKVSEKTVLEQQQMKTSAATGSRVKIPVAEDGLYYIDAADISAATGINSTTIKYWIGIKYLSMSNQGLPVAYLPARNNMGMFFYGTGTDSVYTRNNIYWIDRGKGLTMRNETGSVPAPPAAEEAFSDSLHIEKDVFPNMSQTNNPAEDYWDWDMIYLSVDYSDGPKSFNFSVNGKADTQKEASLQVHLVGGSDSGISPDHHVVVKLNGQQIGEGLWGGLNPYSLTATFSQSLINEGENTIEVQGLLDDGIPWSMFLIDSFDLNYQRLYESEGDRLFFKGDGNQSVKVKGFTSTTPDILLFNVTNPRTPILNTSAIIDGSTGNYGISFKPGSPDARYLAIARDAAVRVVNAQGANPSSLRSPGNIVDYLIIAPNELASAVRPLADYRSQGMRSKVVTVDDIMNEFNFGLSSPETIRQFLTYAYKYWSRPPKYVLLAGGGTWDYKDNEVEGGNLIPPALVPTSSGLSTSDNYLADINGDHVPEMAIGRLPVLTPQEMQNVIGKIKTFEAAVNNRVIMVADNPDDGGDFSPDSEIIAGLFPSRYILEKVYLGEYPSTETARMTLFNYINAGSVFFNYIGHASFDMFTAEGLFTSDDIGSLINGTGPPVITAMTCTAGEFAIPGYPAIGQLMLLKNGGGATAFWSATGLSDNAEAKILNREFYNAVFNSNKRVLGDAVLQAFSKYKTSGSMPFMMDIYTILGDPALKLK